MKIRTRLILLFLLISMLPLALFSYFDLRQEEASLRAEAQIRISSLADNKAIQVRSYLDERLQDVRFLAHDMGATGVLPGLHSSSQLRGAAYAAIEAQTRHYFSHYVEETGIFYDAFLITPQGDIVYSQKREADFTTNLLTGPYRDSQLAQAFRNASQKLEPVISRYEHYEPSSAPALFMAAPVMIEGKFRGVFAVQLGNEAFFRMAKDRVGLGESGEIIFGHREGEDLLFISPLEYRNGGAPKLRMKSAEDRMIPMFSAVSGESGSGLREDYRGKQVVAAWRYLPELDWGMVVKIDADEALAAIGQQQKLTLQALLGLLMLAGLVSYLMGRQISLPLQNLVQTVGEMSAGNLDKRADENAPGELGLFAQTFNRFAGKLQALYHTLEERVEERTRDLNATNEQLQEEIYEREQIESVLRESQAELLRNQDLLNEAQRLGKMGSWELDLVTGKLVWSNEVFRIFELDPVQFSPSYENFLKVIHPDDRHLVDQAYTQSLKDRQPYDIEHRLKMADGRIKWVHEHCTNYFDESGKAVRSRGAVQDVTAQKQAEEQLRIAAAAFDTHEAILIADANANIIRVNKAFEKTTGYRAEEVVGKNPRILSSGRQNHAFYEEMWRQLLGKGKWTGELWDKRKNGEIYPKWLTITAIKNSRGETTEYIAIFSDITKRKQAEEEIRNLAFYDTLTKLPNRRLLLDRFHLALSVSSRSRHYGAILFLDMDKFKTLNDTQGHDYGDLLLIEVAQRIRLCVREVDTVARLGGDEFVVLIEEIGANAQDASQRVALIAEKIRLALTLPYQLKGHEHHCSTSIGVCLYCGNGESVETLLSHADLAMYQAKDSGRDTVRFFDPAMQRAVELRSELEADLRRALPNRELQLYYQIQVDVDYRPLGAEALARWIHPKRGMVSPLVFIPVAEESTLILDIGHWVMDTACRQLAVWHENECTRNLTLSVNVSAQQFRLHDFVDRVAAMLRAHRVDPSRLKLELTESVVLNDVADVVTKMHALKALGVGLSLDDFGTGYSSLAYLKRLPLDQLKIDQSFVRDIVSDSNDAVMVQTIIDLAQNFHLNVIAEGVETSAQLEFLKHNGCMAYQGYLFGKPMPLENFEALLEK